MMVPFSLAELAQASEQLLRSGLEKPTPLTLLLVFAGGLLTSLGPCSLSLLPVSVAYWLVLERARPGSAVLASAPVWWEPW